MHEEFAELLQLLGFVRHLPAHPYKAVCQFAEVSAQVAAQIHPIVGRDVTGFRFSVDSYGLQHALTGHSQERGSKDHHALLEADILALPAWLIAPLIVKAGNALKNPLQPPRVRFERLELFSTFKTVVISEVRTGRRQLALITMYKTEND